MKNIIKPILLTAISLSMSITLNAQEKIKVGETTEKINDYSGNALTVVFNRADEKTISKEWKRTMKHYKASTSTKGNEIRATDVSIPSISDYPIQVFAKVKENKDKQNVFYVIFLNGDQSISSKSDASGYTAAKSIVEGFANSLSKNAAKDYQKTQERLLKNYNKELKSNAKDTKDDQKSIENKQKEIKNLGEDIKKRQKKQEELKKKIETQKGTVKDAEKEVGLYK